MYTLRKRVTVPLVLIAALVVTPSLTGCSALSGILSKATGGQVNIGGASIPKDFPSDVPIISGQIVNGSSIKKDGSEVWNIIVKVSGLSDFDKISSDLTGKGFKPNPDATTKSDSSATGEFVGEKYDVVVLISGDSKSGFIANYTVTDIKK